MKCFKVCCRTEGGSFWSLIQRSPRYQLKYELGEVCLPPGKSKIFVFPDLEDAITFANSFAVKGLCPQAILVGEAKGARRRKRVCTYSPDFDAFWLKEKVKKLQGWGPPGRADAPLGTYTCDSFTPERVLTESEVAHDFVRSSSPA